MTRRHEHLWLDLETTGLDPSNGVILEFAAVLCEDDRAGDMAIVQEFDSVVLPMSADGIPLDGADAAHWARELMDPYVVNMHTKNGLLADLEDPAKCCTLEEAEAFLCTLVPEGERATLAGNSVHFDLAWLRFHMPRFAKRLSHRVLDVSTLIGAEQAWGDSAQNLREAGGPAHRALADVRASIASAKAFRARRYP